MLSKGQEAAHHRHNELMNHHTGNWLTVHFISSGDFFTMRSKGSSVSAALSSSSLYSSSSHMRCRVLRGSLSSTGMDTLDRSLPMLFRKMFQRLMLLVSGQGADKQLRRPLRKALPAKSPLATEKKINNEKKESLLQHPSGVIICNRLC